MKTKRPNRKGMSALVMVTSLILVSTALVIGVWIMSSMEQAVTLPTTAVAEDLTLVNVTAKTLSYPYLNSLTSVFNSSDTLPQDSMTGPETGCTVTSTTITCYFNSTYQAGTYTVSYTYNPQAANTTLGTMFSTTWSSFQLGVVALVIIAAVSIIGLLITGFGRTGEAV